MENISNMVRYHLAKLSGRISFYLSKLGPGSGGNFSGFVFNKIGGENSLKKLARRVKIGSVLVTGTNGKTTTTMLLIKLLSSDNKIRSSFENNTINSITTAILNQKGNLGVFEYGIRNVKFGIPDKVQNLINPIGIVYTTISKEHSQVNGVKNPFNSYFYAKKLLSQGMKRGCLVCNGDDPYTAYIGISKCNDLKVNFFGIEAEGIEDIFNPSIDTCPNCGAKLNYSKRFLNHRGYYSCQCGFKRPEVNVKLTDIKTKGNKLNLRITGEAYNYINKVNVAIDLNLSLPHFGVHNIYNTLASITAYVTFTPHVENIKKTINTVFDNLDMSFIPPGRFEVVNVDEKTIGVGQGDNGDAIKINALYMNHYVNGPLEFIYTTPDENEDEIFDDQFDTIKQLKPAHVIVVPGRKSVKNAHEYYSTVREEFKDAEFYECDEMPERIAKLTDLAKNSKYYYVIITGCGEEQKMWEKIKQNILNG